VSADELAWVHWRIRRAPSALILLAMVFGAAACGGGSSTPKGFLQLGIVDGATVYGRLESSPPEDGATEEDGQRLALLIKRGDGTFCNGIGSASAVRAAPICSDLAKTTYSYALAVPKGTEEVHRCLESYAGAPVRVEVLRTPSNWPADLAVSVLYDTDGPLTPC
jgi:hypothetical protein